jgi:hypothetical protein
VAGYSGTPLAQKLGIKPGACIALLHAPADFAEELDPLPEGVAIRTTARGPLDVVLLFATSRTDVERAFTRTAGALEPAGGLWVVWPKKASGVPTDLTENLIREIGLAAGLVDNKVCAVNETWSGLRFVIRVKDRPKPARVTAPSTRPQARVRPPQSATTATSRRART